MVDVRGVAETRAAQQPHAVAPNRTTVASKARVVKRLGENRGIRNIAVFGSVARGDARPDSDIDLLVDADPGTSLFDIAGFEQDLEEVFGRPVVIITRGSLRDDRPKDRVVLIEAVAL